MAQVPEVVADCCAIVDLARVAFAMHPPHAHLVPHRQLAMHHQTQPVVVHHEQQGAHPRHVHPQQQTQPAAVHHVQPGGHPRYVHPQQQVFRQSSGVSATPRGPPVTVSYSGPPAVSTPKLAARVGTASDGVSQGSVPHGVHMGSHHVVNAPTQRLGSASIPMNHSHVAPPQMARSQSSQVFRQVSGVSGTPGAPPPSVSYSGTPVASTPKPAVAVATTSKGISQIPNKVPQGIFMGTVNDSASIMFDIPAFS
uniref:Uncharacterized protein n=1 Tax=Noctiluca scintillans TaxID=2966 RepID=A0A7S1FJF6_NOCSC